MTACLVGHKSRCTVISILYPICGWLYLLDGHWKHRIALVVDVFPDEIDSAWIVHDLS